MIYKVSFQNQFFTIFQMTVTFYFLPKNLETTEFAINHELTLLFQWLRSNKLSLNETNTELIIFRSP